MKNDKTIIQINIIRFITRRFQHLMHWLYTLIGTFVEKGKISYFGLARNLIQHLISPNQDDLSYSARVFLYGQQEIG